MLLLILQPAGMDLLQLDQHRLLLIGRFGQQLIDLLLQQLQRGEIVPQAVFQQHQVERGDGVAPAEEGAGLQQAQGLFQRRSETYGACSSASSR